MPDDLATDQPSTETPTVDLAAENAKLRQKNDELREEKRKLRQLEKIVADIPEGVDVRELLTFKQQTEQQKLEAEGNYREARERLEAQFREREKTLQDRIDALEAELRQLRVVSPAVAALADAVHDPEEVIALKLKPEQIEKEADGSVVVVDGYQRTPILDWARATLPQWRLKAPKPAGSGAPPGRSGGGDIPAGQANPFLPDSYDLTEQCRLYNVDKDLYWKLRDAAR